MFHVEQWPVSASFHWRKTMPDPTKRLGRGISSLLSDSKASRLADQLPDSVMGDPNATATTQAPARHRTIRVPLDCVAPNPKQPRRSISEQGIAGLAGSIKRNGIIQPIVIRPVGGTSASGMVGPVATQGAIKYELIAGERRWRAARAAGLSDVPAILRDATEEQLLELALVENIHREDLNAIDRAIAYGQFRDEFGLAAEQIGERVGEDRTTVTNYLRLLELPSEIQDLVASDLLSMGHARALAGLRSRDEQIKLAEYAVRKGFSVRTLEESVRKLRGPAKTTSAGGGQGHRNKRPLIRDLERRFTQILKTKVTIQEGRGKNTGQLVIEYHSIEEFEAICERLGN